MTSGSQRKIKANLAGLEIILKKPEVAFLRPTEKYKSPIISKFQSPEGKGAAKR